MIERLERKFGKYAIKNLIVYILLGYLIGYLLLFGAKYTSFNALDYLSLEPYYIIHKLQIWRLFTWVVVPPANDILSIIILSFLYYQLGTALEQMWGTFRFNLFMFGGMLITAASVFLVYGFFALFMHVSLVSVSAFVNTYYLCLSIFLAYAVCVPDSVMLLYFIIPIKIKWMAIVYGVLVGYSVIKSIRVGAWFNAVIIVASLLNFLIFYMMNLKKNKKLSYRKNNATVVDFRDNSRRADFKTVSRHKCAICGCTEITNPDLDFRFCSKCNGNYEYCSKHLFTHSHIE